MGKARRTGRGGARPGSGPKPKPPVELKRNRVVIFLDDAEFAELTRAAGAKRPSEFARDIVRRSLVRRRK